MSESNDSAIQRLTKHEDRKGKLRLALEGLVLDDLDRQFEQQLKGIARVENELLGVVPQAAAGDRATRREINIDSPRIEHHHYPQKAALARILPWVVGAGLGLGPLAGWALKSAVQKPPPPSAGAPDSVHTTKGFLVEFDE